RRRGQQGDSPTDRPQHPGRAAPGRPRLPGGAARGALPAPTRPTALPPRRPALPPGRGGALRDRGRAVGLGPGRAGGVPAEGGVGSVRVRGRSVGLGAGRAGGVPADGAGGDGSGWEVMSLRWCLKGVLLPAGWTTFLLFVLVVVGVIAASNPSSSGEDAEQVS